MSQLVQQLQNTREEVARMEKQLKESPGRAQELREARSEVAQMERQLRQLRTTTSTLETSKRNAEREVPSFPPCGTGRS